MIQFIDIAAKHASFECLKILMAAPQQINWSEQKRPVCLLNAIKYNPANLEMINFVMDCLEKVKITFVCDDVFTEVIKYDLVDIAKRIVNNRWHKITDKDESLAGQLNLGCSEWLKSRRSAFDFNACSTNDDGLTLEDDDWGDEDNESFGDDDDWAKTPVN